MKCDKLYSVSRYAMPPSFTQCRNEAKLKGRCIKHLEYNMIRIISNDDMIHHIEKNETGRWTFLIGEAEIDFHGSYSKIHKQVKRTFVEMQDAAHGEIILIKFDPKCLHH